MSDRIRKLRFSMVTMAILLLLLSPSMTLAQDPPSAAVEQGALAWNNWTNEDSGGNGTLPAGVDNSHGIVFKNASGHYIVGISRICKRRMFICPAD